MVDRVELVESCATEDVASLCGGSLTSVDWRLEVLMGKMIGRCVPGIACEWAWQSERVVRASIKERRESRLYQQRRSDAGSPVVRHAELKLKYPASP